MVKQSIRPGSTNYFHLGGKIDPVSEIINAGILTTGDVFWVKDADDADYLEFADRVGQNYIYTDIQSAIDKCTDDQNDYVMICPKTGGSAYDLTTGLNLNKDKVHLIGVGSGQRGDSDYGVRIRGFGTSSTATTIDHYGLLYITGDGCEVAGIKFEATAGTGAGGTIGGAGSINSDSGGVISVYGQNLRMHDCYVQVDGGAWDVGTPSAAILVGSAKHGGWIDNCHITTGTETADGTQHGIDLRMNNERWKVTNTVVEFFATNAEEGFISLSPGTALGMGQAIVMENCTLLNYNSATAVTEMVAGSAMKYSFGFMKDCAALHCTAFHSTDDLVLFAPAFASGTTDAVFNNPNIALPGSVTILTET